MEPKIQLTTFLTFQGWNEQVPGPEVTVMFVNQARAVDTSEHGRLVIPTVTSMG